MYVFVCVFACVPIYIRVLETLDRVANAFPVENRTVAEEDNVVVEVVSMMQSALELNGFSTNLLGRGNAVILPPALFRRFNMQPAARITTVSINNRNLLQPHNGNRLRGNILSVNVDVGDLSGLGNDERIQLNFVRVRAMQLLDYPVSVYMIQSV